MLCSRRTKKQKGKGLLSFVTSSSSKTPKLRLFDNMHRTVSLKGLCIALYRIWWKPFSMTIVCTAGIDRPLRGSQCLNGWFRFSFDGNYVYVRHQGRYEHNSIDRKLSQVSFHALSRSGCMHACISVCRFV